MTFQFSGTLILCGIAVGVETPCKFPSKHPSIIDVSNPKPGDQRMPMPMKCSALRRGYLAKWEIEEDDPIQPITVQMAYRDFLDSRKELHMLPYHLICAHASSQADRLAVDSLSDPGHYFPRAGMLYC